METKKCPYCAEIISIDAKKCKHCGEFLDETLRFEQQSKNKSDAPKEIIVKNESSGLVTFLVVLGIIALLVYLFGI
jgi:predicted nucleic acid-binding Zn ribbon protein